MPVKTLKSLFQNQLLTLRPGNAIYNFAVELQSPLGAIAGLWRHEGQCHKGAEDKGSVVLDGF